jgi:hypothetical protein
VPASWALSVTQYSGVPSLALESCGCSFVGEDTRELLRRHWFFPHEVLTQEVRSVAMAMVWIDCVSCLRGKRGTTRVRKRVEPSLCLASLHHQRQAPSGTRGPRLGLVGCCGILICWILSTACGRWLRRSSPRSSAYIAVKY